jgi:hypothetical protein
MRRDKENKAETTDVRSIERERCGQPSERFEAGARVALPS